MWSACATTSALTRNAGSRSRTAARSRRPWNGAIRSIPCQFCGKKIPLVDLIEQKFASPESTKRVREMDEQAQTVIDNESRELILVGHAFAIAGEAGQIFRPIPNSDWGIDGEIEFKDYARTGQRQAGLPAAQVGRFVLCPSASRTTPRSSRSRTPAAPTTGSNKPIP